jgi:hypothetical protein
VNQPEEFKIHIEPDGRIIIEGAGLEGASYRRILDFLAETVGPVRDIADADPSDARLDLLRGHKAKPATQVEQKTNG